MTKNNIVAIRSNCTFALNYETSKLTPQAELILINISPVYKDKGSSIQKSTQVTEFRTNVSLEALNHLIGELQILVKNMTQFDQLAGGLNAVIDANKQKP